MVVKKAESTALDQAKAKCGNAKSLAERLGITPQALSQWKRVPVERVLSVEKVTGISRHDLRPDIFGEHPRSAA